MNIEEISLSESQAHLQNYFATESLEYKQASDFLQKIIQLKPNAALIAALIAKYMLHEISADEISAFVDRLLSYSRLINLDPFDPIDICGTGGDQKSSINISTLTAFVVAASGYKVAKHGNYAVSSSSGSSNILESLGINLSADPEYLRSNLEKYNLCFIHAPHFNSQLASFGKIRKELGLASFLNILGPLLNPAQPKNCFFGVNSRATLRKYDFILKRRAKRYGLVHSLDGFDEISLTADFYYYTDTDSQLIELASLGLSQISANQLSAKNSKTEQIKLFVEILSAESELYYQQVIAVNAAFVIMTLHRQFSFEQAYAQAFETIKSKAAYKLLKNISESI